MELSTCIGNAKNIAVAFDSSGGIDETMFNRFIDVLVEAVSGKQDIQMDVWCFDTQVHRPIMLWGDDVEQLRHYKLRGHGGTLLECNFTHMVEQKIKPDVIVVFTDAAIPDYEKVQRKYSDYCRVVFAIIENPYNYMPPFGDIVEFRA